MKELNENSYLLTLEAMTLALDPQPDETKNPNTEIKPWHEPEGRYGV